MRIAFGIFLILAGIALGLYVGLWVCFIGGIVNVIDEVRAPELSGLNVAIGVVKILGAGFCGTISAVFLIIPGGVILSCVDRQGPKF